MTVILTYFDAEGRFHSSGEYRSELFDLCDIWDEVEEKALSGCLPDLYGDDSVTHALVEVPYHRYSHPRLFGVAKP